MSSHHIIRENQEAALILANGAACSDDLLYDLLEWSPFTVVLDGAMERALMKQISADLVIGDFDSLKLNECYTDIPGSVQQVHIADQHTTDFEKGLEYLIHNGHRAVHVLWATGLRLDHTWNNLLSMAKYATQIQITLLDDHSNCFILDRSFQKQYPVKTKISLMPVTDVLGLSTFGLKYNLNNENLIVPLRTGSSNEVIGSGLVGIRHSAGILALIESRD